MKKQLLVIHGGDTFRSYEDYFNSLKAEQIDLESMLTKGWKSLLGERLGEEYQVIAPRMPNSLNAQYPEWKLWLEKILPLLNDEIILVGHSLGGTFLVKYLSTQKVSKNIRGVFLVAPCYDESAKEDGEREYLGEFLPPKGLGLLQDQTGEIFLYHSQDDDIVPFSSLKDYAKALPEAKVREFSDRGHFLGEDFPELTSDILSLK